MNTHKGQRICFTNTNSPINESYIDFEERYALEKIVDVFYNHKSQTIGFGAG